MSNWIYTSLVFTVLPTVDLLKNMQVLKLTAKYSCWRAGFGLQAVTSLAYLIGTTC